MLHRIVSHNKDIIYAYKTLHVIFIMSFQGLWNQICVGKGSSIIDLLTLPVCSWAFYLSGR